MFLYFRKNKVKFVLIAAILFTCIISSTIAYSQTHTKLPKRITIGVRTNIPVLGKFNQNNEPEESFCLTLGKQLERELFNQDVGIRVDFDIVSNENRGPDFPRYHGLKNGKHNMQCGANSISPRSNIIFSDTFYQTGIKLLIKTEIFNQYLKNLSREDRRIKVKKDFQIAVEHNTTTYSNLTKKDFKVKEYPNRETALNALNTQQKIAFASDAIILRSFIKEGYPGDIEFQQEDYILFPEQSRDYIINTPENYGIAISDVPGKTGQYSGELKEAINRVLQTPALKEERKKLQNYEDGGQSDDGESKEPDPPINPLLILAIALTAVGMILTLVTHIIK